MITCSTLCSQYSQHIGFYHNIDHCKQYFPSHVQFSLSPFPETSSSTDCMAAALALSLARYSFLAMASRTHLGSGLMTHCSHTATTSSRCSNPNTVPTTYLAVKFGCRGMGRCVVCVDWERWCECGVWGGMLYVWIGRVKMCWELRVDFDRW